MNAVSFSSNKIALEEILPVKFFEALERSGICTSKQIITLSVWDMKKCTNLTTEDIHFVKNIVSNHLTTGSITCDVLLAQENNNKKVVTGCKLIDRFLRGGFRKGTLTEIYGESGSGKTQIGVQAAAYNWSDGSVYICTEDLFPVKRYEQIKTHLPNFSSNVDYGKNTYIEHITESQDLLSCIRIRLPKLLSKNKLSLIVIDSVAAPYRVDVTNYVQRAEELRELAISLIRIAQEHNVAVICINQVTSAFNETDDVMPSLGLAWSNMICTRLKLRKTKQTYGSNKPTGEDPEDLHINIRELCVEFSPDLPNSVIKCVITSNGIKGISD